MANEKSIKIVRFTTLGAEMGPLCQGVADSFKNFFSTLGEGSSKHKKTVLRMCLLIPITKQLILQLSSAIVDFYVFHDGLLI